MTAGNQPVSAAFTIVVVEDNPELASLIAKTLNKESFEASVAADAETGLKLARQLSPDMVLLDVSLPGIDGIEACRLLREFSDAYVIMLTAQSSEADRLAGLAIGADDYMTKPFYPRELVARIRAMQRRPRPSASGGVGARHFGKLRIDPEMQQVLLDERAVVLSRIEFGLLNALSAQPTRTMSRADLLSAVWGGKWHGGEHVIDVHISNLRRKLGDDPSRPRYVRTVRGRGFQMGTGQG